MEEPLTPSHLLNQQEREVLELEGQEENLKSQPFLHFLLETTEIHFILLMSDDPEGIITELIVIG